MAHQQQLLFHSDESKDTTTRYRLLSKSKLLPILQAKSPGVGQHPPKTSPVLVGQLGYLLSQQEELEHIWMNQFHQIL